MSAIDLQKINREMEKKKRWVQSFWGEVRDGGGIVYMAVSSPLEEGRHGLTTASDGKSN